MPPLLAQLAGAHPQEAGGPSGLVMVRALKGWHGKKVLLAGSQGSALAGRQKSPLNLNMPAEPTAAPEDGPAPARAPNPPKGCGNGGRGDGWELAMHLLNEQKKSLQTC